MLYKDGSYATLNLSVLTVQKSINEIDIHSIEEHFHKYANPYNMFVLPKEIGDLGEITSIY